MNKKYIFIEYKRAEFLRVYSSTKDDFVFSCMKDNDIGVKYFNAVNDLILYEELQGIDKEEAKLFFHTKGFLYLVSIGSNHYFYNNNKDLMSDWEMCVLFMQDYCDMFKVFSVENARHWIQEKDYDQFPRFENGIKIYPLIKELIYGQS